MKRRIYTRLAPVLCVLLLGSVAHGQTNPGMTGPSTVNPAISRPASFTNSMLNPYRFPGGTQPSAYGAMSPYAGYSGAMMGYGMGYGMMGYGMGYGNYSSLQGNQQGYGNTTGGVMAQGYPVESQSNAQEQELSSVLQASGVPQDAGQIRWPVGLLALAAPDVDKLRAQIEGVFRQAASQASQGTVDAHLSHECVRAVAALRHALRKDQDERFAMPLSVYDESERFLNRLERAEHVLSAGMGGPANEPTLRTTRLAELPPKASLMEVDLYDNFFAPNALYVRTGTTVRWKNRGLHGHTVTSDDGGWGSKKMGMGEAYDHAFEQPGTYFYHCAVHQAGMVGVVVVK